MRKDSPIVQSLWRAAAIIGYVALVTTLMSNGAKLFGEQDHALVPVFMLLLFVVSATVTSLLVLGKPFSLFVGGAKKEALSFLLMTLGWLVAFLVLVGIIMAAS